MVAAWLGLRFVKLREAYRASDLQSSFRSSDDEYKHSNTLQSLGEQEEARTEGEQSSSEEQDNRILECLDRQGSSC